MSSLYTHQFVHVGTRKVVNRGGGTLTVNLPEALKDNVGLVGERKYSAAFYVHPQERDVIIRFKEIKEGIANAKPDKGVK